MAKSAEIKLKTVTIRLISEHIVENVIHDYANIDAEHMLELKEANKQLTQGMPYAVLVDSGEYTSITKEARELAASDKFKDVTIANAIIVNSLGHKIIGNFYMNINKPKIKTKIFSDRDKAIEWLKVQVASSNLK